MGVNIWLLYTNFKITNTNVVSAQLRLQPRVCLDYDSGYGLSGNYNEVTATFAWKSERIIV